jgi:hypothetical protein
MPACPNRLQNQAADSTCTIDGALTMEGGRYLFAPQPLFVAVNLTVTLALLLLLDCSG